MDLKLVQSEIARPLDQKDDSSGFRGISVSVHDKIFILIAPEVLTAADGAVSAPSSLFGELFLTEDLLRSVLHPSEDSFVTMGD